VFTQSKQLYCDVWTDQAVTPNTFQEVVALAPALPGYGIRGSTVSSNSQQHAYAHLHAPPVAGHTTNVRHGTAKGYTTASSSAPGAHFEGSKGSQ
jgi:hypothetical protein